MAHFWNPFSDAEFENQDLILRLPDSGLYIRVEGPIVELLSQLPFDDIDASVVEWRDRTSHSDAEVHDASKIWHKLCDWGAVKEESIREEGISKLSSKWVKLDANHGQSIVIRYVDSQEFLGDEEMLQIGA